MVRILYTVRYGSKTRLFWCYEEPFSKPQNHTFIAAAISWIKTITDVNFWWLLNCLTVLKNVAWIV